MFKVNNRDTRTPERNGETCLYHCKNENNKDDKQICRIVVNPLFIDIRNFHGQSSL